MEITFLGTRGYIDHRTKKHYRHTSTLITNRGKKIMIDCGLDWQKRVWQIKPDAIILTHAHPDHALGLKNGAPCPVYATRATWRLINNYLIAEGLRHTIFLTKAFTLFGVKFQAIANVHSIIAPAVSLRIIAHKKIIFYAGDVAYLPRTKKVLKNSDLYIGDGSTINQPLIRKRDGTIYGHATLSAQLTWCQKAGINRAIITHCGSQIVAHPRTGKKRIDELAIKKNVAVTIAYDGLTILL